MLNKLFGKKKKDYYLEIEEKPATQQNEPEEVVSEEAKTEEGTTATKVESEKVEKGKAVAKSTVKTVSSPSVSYEPPAWVKAIKNYSNTNDNESNGSKNAKPSYLMVDKPKPSRRPGPSLNEFKKMANNIKK